MNSALGLSLFRPAGLGALALPPRLAHAHCLPSAILGHRRPDATFATRPPPGLRVSARLLSPSAPWGWCFWQPPCLY